MNSKLIVLATCLAAVIFIQAVPFLINDKIDMVNLYNYADTEVPDYVFLEETHTSEITDELATLGRVLFYDKQLSLNESISCASCHKQEFAFGDTLVASPGFDEKLTERHSTRLVNLNYNHMPQVFWDGRAKHLDSLPVMVLTNSIEMGFSGKDGQPAIDSLVRRLENIDYYNPLFELAFGDTEKSTDRINVALTQFVKSIESYDSKYDRGRSMVAQNTDLFPNFTFSENRGKDIFLSPFPEDNPFTGIIFTGNGPEAPLPPQPAFHLGKMGCADCHGIDNFTSRETSLTGNNGIIGVIGHPNEIDTTVKRSPSLRNLINPQGIEVGPFMHDGSLATLMDVMDHYATIGLPGHKKTPRLHTSLNITAPSGSYTGPATGNAGPSGASGPIGISQQFSPRLAEVEMQAVIDFLKTLTGSNIYTDPKWSDPFDAFGELTLIDDCPELKKGYISTTICEGEEYEGFHIPGTHEKRIIIAGACDSIVVIDLAVEELVEQYETVTICEGERHRRYGNAGSYVDLLSNPSGCDTINYLDLEVTPALRHRVQLSFCEGTTVEGYTEAGNYIDTIPNEQNGCYIIRQVRVTEKDFIYSPHEYVNICEGQSYNGHSTRGWHRDTLWSTTPLACDTINQVYIEFRQLLEENISVNICEGDSYSGYSQSGNYVIEHTNEEGCDSLLYLDLKVHPTTESTIRIEICEGEQYDGYTTAGQYVDILSNKNNCDSTRYLDLIILAHSESVEQVSICRGDSHEGYTVEGSYSDNYTNAVGCDSTRYLYLTVDAHTESHIEAEICNGESFEEYNTSGQYVDVLTSTAGCDSTRHIYLTVLDHTESYNELAICDGTVHEGYTLTGNYVDIFQNAQGCDSTRHLSLVVLENSYSYDRYEICEGEDIWGYDKAGLYTDVLTNQEGCDSTRVLDLVILDHSDSYEEVHLCPGEAYEGYKNGTHQEYYTNAVGCDSTRYIDIINIDQSDAICAGASDHKIRSIEETTYIKVGPNPAHGEINITIDKPDRLPAVLKVYDAYNNLVSETIIEESTTRIDLSEYSSGIYLIHIQHGLNIYLSKVIKL